jgi:hypothetical protein
MTVSASRMVATIVLLGAVGAARHAHATAAPSDRYTIANGTVLDTKTKLTWQQAVPTVTTDGGVMVRTFTQAAAVSYCGSLSLNGTGWRLPTMKEIMTLINSSVYSPAIDSTAFPNTAVTSYWTSTPSSIDPGFFWLVGFFDGGSGAGDPSQSAVLRCVR